MSTRSLARNAALLAISFVLALGAAEAGLRLATRAHLTPGLESFDRYMSYADRKYYLDESPVFHRSDDADLGWEAIPGSYREGVLRVNSAGFRGPDRPVAKPSGTHRIAVLGDSEVFGELLAEEDTLVGRLQAELPGAEVINFGVIGYNTEQEFALLRKKVLRYQPDAVLLYYVFNDPELPERVLHFQGGGVLHDSWLYNLGLWVTAMRTGAEPAVPFRGSFNDYYLRLHDSAYFERVRGLVAEMGAYCAARGIRFALVIAPEVFEVPDLDAGYPYGPIHAKLRALASPNVQVIDPLSALATAWVPADPKALWAAEFDPHKNARANAVIARAIASQLSDL